MRGLFDKDPSFRLRDSKGRYTTAEKYHYERIAEINIKLRYERDKYYRAWLAMGSSYSRVLRENKKLKDEITQLKNNIHNLL